jgi:hypothetical protein
LLWVNLLLQGEQQVIHSSTIFPYPLRETAKLIKHDFSVDGPGHLSKKDSCLCGMVINSYNLV